MELQRKGTNGGLATILTGLGSMSYGELAGERMKLGLILHDPEEEQDCFSDNTHNSHYYDALGHQERLSRPVPPGRRVDGPGASLADLVRAKEPALDAEMRASSTQPAAMRAIKDAADRGGMAYDQMIGEDNPEGNAIVQAVIDGLLDQTRTIENDRGRARSRAARAGGLRQPRQSGGRVPVSGGGRMRRTG